MLSVRPLVVATCALLGLLGLARVLWYVMDPVALATVPLGELALALACGVFPALGLGAWFVQARAERSWSGEDVLASNPEARPATAGAPRVAGPEPVRAVPARSMPHPGTPELDDFLRVAEPADVDRPAAAPVAPVPAVPLAETESARSFDPVLEWSLARQIEALAREATRDVHGLHGAGDGPRFDLGSPDDMPVAPGRVALGRAVGRAVLDEVPVLAGVTPGRSVLGRAGADADARDARVPSTAHHLLRLRSDA